MAKFQLNFTDDCYSLSYNSSVLKDKNNKKEIIFGYVRISSDLQKNNESIESQIKMIENTCQYRDLVLAYIFVDQGISGKNLERPGFSELFDEIKKHVVIQHNLLSIMTCYLHRLTRSKESITFLCKELPPLNIGLISLDCPGIDIKNPRSHTMLYLLTDNNESMRLSTIQNIKNIMRQMSEDGELILKSEYGWVYVNKYKYGGKRIKLPEIREQMIISKIIDMWNKSDRTMKESVIAFKLNEDLDNYYYKEESKEWTFPRVRKIIYKQLLSERVIPIKYPVNLKDEVCTKEIIHMIREENLMTKVAEAIGKMLDAKCLYKHRITGFYVQSILDSLSKKYLDQIDINFEEYKIKLIETIRSRLKKLSRKDIVKYLNENNFVTYKGKSWTNYNLGNFIYKEKIKPE